MVESRCADLCSVRKTNWLELIVPLCLVCPEREEGRPGRRGSGAWTAPIRAEVVARHAPGGGLRRANAIGESSSRCEAVCQT